MAYEPNEIFYSSDPYLYAPNRQHNVPADNLVPIPQRYQVWGASGTGTVTATSPRPVQVGDLVLFVQASNGGIFAPTDDLGNTFQVVPSAGGSTKFWYCVVTVGGFSTLSASVPSGHPIAWSAIEIQGGFGIDVVAFGVAGGSAANSGTTGTPNFTADLAVGLIEANVASSPAITAQAFSPALPQTTVEAVQITPSNQNVCGIFDAATDPSQALAATATIGGTGPGFTAAIVLVRGGLPIPQPLAYSKKPWDAFGFEQPWDDWASLYAHRKFLDTTQFVPPATLSIPRAHTPFEMFEADPYDNLYATRHRRYLDWIARIGIRRARTPYEMFGMDGPWEDWVGLYRQRRYLETVTTPPPPPLTPTPRAHTPYELFDADPYDNLYATRHRRHLDAISRTGVPRRQRPGSEFYEDDPNWVLYAAPHRRAIPPAPGPWWPRRAPPLVQLHQWDDWVDLYSATRRRVPPPSVVVPPFGLGRKTRIPHDGFGYDEPWSDWAGLFARHRIPGDLFPQPPPPPPPIIVDSGAPIMAVDLNPVRGYDVGVIMAADLNPVRAIDETAIMAADLPPVRGNPR